MSFDTRCGLSMANLGATRQPMECAKRVRPLVMLAVEQRALASAANEAMLSLLRGFVGERPWPSRSKRWHL